MIACSRDRNARLRWLACAALVTGLGCASTRPTRIDTGDGLVHLLPSVDDCDDGRKARIVLEREQPVTVLVHGVHATTGSMAELAKVFRSHGQQTVCFDYNDRHALEFSSGQLLYAVSSLRMWTRAPKVTVVGHSLGGLVSRRALVRNRSDGRRLWRGKVELVTVATPFAGVRSAAACSSVPYHMATMGVSLAVCRSIAGRKWRDIFPESRFVTKPGTLAPVVERHLEIITNETGSCRERGSDGACLADDFVFTISEQRNPAVELDPRATYIEIRAGHALVVGRPPDRTPSVLADVLRAEGLLPREIRDALAPADARDSAVREPAVD